MSAWWFSRAEDGTYTLGTGNEEKVKGLSREEAAVLKEWHEKPTKLPVAELFEIPNIEALDDTDLIVVRDHLSNLYHLTANILLARADRLSGDIEKALRSERQVEHLYKRLPKSWRW